MTETSPYTGWASPGRRVLKSRGFLWGVLLFVALLLFSFVGPHVYSYDATTINVSHQFLSPSLRFPLGTNALGQNELARLMLGGELPVVAGVVAMAVVMILGATIGISAGLLGGAWDSVLMWLADGILSIPQIVLILFLEVARGSTPTVLVAAVAITSWPAVARIVRAQVMLIKRLEFVEAARAVGNSSLRIALRHIVPNTVGVLLTVGVAQFANAVMMIAIATFIGLGVGPFDWASMMASDFHNVTTGQWWLVVPPGLLFSLLIVSVHLMGNSAKRALFPSGGR
ncbi:MAG: ABC transporter permease [Thermaerobacter sp.]|nr:ABC transporter permease [Thermaerobacter sp.]